MSLQLTPLLRSHSGTLRRRLGLCVVLLFCTALSLSQQAQTSAQADTAACRDTVKRALSEAFKRCGDLGRNRICYGNTVAEAQPKAGVTTFNFAAPGDVVATADLASLKLGGYNAETGQWGVALLKIQSNVAGANLGSGVTVIVFGDTELKDASAPGQTPLQAFYLRNGVGMPGCEKVPADGLLIQSPKGKERVQIAVNGVELRIGSTVFLSTASDPNAPQSPSLNVETLEGMAEITADGFTLEVPAGSSSDVLLQETDDGFAPIEGPSELEAIEGDAFEVIPFEELPEPLDPAELEEAWNATDGPDADATVEPSGDDGGSDDGSGNDGSGEGGNDGNGDGGGDPSNGGDPSDGGDSTE
jgi:hypothetical protein